MLQYRKLYYVLITILSISQNYNRARDAMEINLYEIKIYGKLMGLVF